MKLSRFSIRRPVFTIVTMFLVIILGIVSLLNIPMKLIPEINPPIGVVVTNYEGASPEEVVEKVSKPLEEALSTVEGLNTISSTSEENASLVLLRFSWTSDIDEVQDEIMSSMENIPLPEGAEDPRFLKFDPSQFPIIQLSLTSTSDNKQLQDLADDLKQELTKAEGVASVNLSGLSSEQVSVLLDQEKLKQYNLTQSEIVDVVRSNKISLPGDQITTDGKQLTTRVISTIDSLDILRDLVVTRDAQGEKITLDQVATVEIKEIEKKSITRANQESSVLVSVLQQSDANTAEVSENFQERLDELLEDEKYESVKADILFDQGDYIEQAINNMMRTLLLGGLFAMIVLFLFLRSVKSPLIIGVAIPYSVIVTFVLIYFSDFTLNIMTLGGLALGIGMLVDNAIVVIENIYRHLSMGKSSKEAAYEGAKEMGPAIIASTLTTVAVFVPVVFIQGLIGQLFKEFAMTIAFSLFASLFVALTVVPMLASKWLKVPKENVENKRQESRFMQSLESLVKWALRRRGFVLTLTLVIFLGSLAGLYRVGAVFLPATDEGYFSVGIELENGTSLEETKKVINAVEKELEDKDDVDVYVSLIGSNQEESFRGTGQTNIAEMYVNMVPLDKRDQSTFDFVDDIERDIESTARNVNKTAEVTFNLQSSTGSEPNTLSFNVRNADEEQLKEDVEKIASAIDELEDVTNVVTDLSDTVEELQITVDREKALDKGLVPGQIATVVNQVTRGTDAIQITNADNNEIYMVNVQYDETVTENIGSLEKLLIKTPLDEFVQLSEVATIEKGEGPTEINRIEKENAVEVSVKYNNTTNLGEISQKVDEEIEELELDEDETKITFSGDRELLENNIDDMLLAFVLAIVFIYIVMAAQFESFKYPLVIMFTVPLMIVGVSIALVLTNTPLSLTVIIGIIVLAGIVVNNAIVIVDYINQLKEDGMKSYDAIVKAVKVRLRPVLMTASTTILGLLPLAIGLGEGTEINQPLGVSVIGGLITSTLLTLLVIPVVYSLFDKQTRKLNKKYATPDGQLIPAYLLEEKIEREEEQAESTEIAETPKDKQQMVKMLEQMIEIVKKDDKENR
ncbi:efflux RND transporter permease subunit [Bacillus carboniphilus]|uniref:Efflux RND transporter permease subunit n=1 Tax=Bacillus carboniphilus TaxID=86663 RepID=A0ABY9JX58_9BACI|nr:efflux RND transporter permease subunit [Bacillus carboniphilus]WLR43093.1 efflux RND transporter permease subunit [Bacillus carboniphilus]